VQEKTLILPHKTQRKSKGTSAEDALPPQPLTRLGPTCAANALC